VQVHYGEGIANHTDPESCAAYREVCGEALTGERAGQPLSHEIFLIQGADAVTYAEGNRINAPRWLWNGVLDLTALQEKAYLEHCRLYALGKPDFS